MPEIKFGSKQTNNPTPKIISNALDASAGICGILIPALNSAPPQVISGDSKDVWTWVLGILIPVFLRIKVYFGVEVNTPTVPTSQVE